MKAVLLLFVNLNLSFICFSQITRSNWLVGGNFSYSKSDSKGDYFVRKGRYIDITANAGYFFLDKAASGLRFNALLSKVKSGRPDNSTTSVEQTNIGIGPFLRYYFLPAENRINILSDAGVSFAKTSNNIVNNAEKSWTSSFGLGPVVFLNSCVGLEFLLVYNHYSSLKMNSTDNTIQFKIGFQLHLEKE